MPDTNAVSEQRLPILMVVVGRQRVGKTTVVNTIIQNFREAGVTSTSEMPTRTT